MVLIVRDSGLENGTVCAQKMINSPFLEENMISLMCHLSSKTRTRKGSEVVSFKNTGFF